MGHFGANEAGIKHGRAVVGERDFHNLPKPAIADITAGARDVISTANVPPVGVPAKTGAAVGVPTNALAAVPNAAAAPAESRARMSAQPPIGRPNRIAAQLAQSQFASARLGERRTSNFQSQLYEKEFNRARTGTQSDADSVGQKARFNLPAAAIGTAALAETALAKASSARRKRSRGRANRAEASAAVREAERIVKGSRKKVGARLAADQRASTLRTASRRAATATVATGRISGRAGGVRGTPAGGGFHKRSVFSGRSRRGIGL